MLKIQLSICALILCVLFSAEANIIPLEDFDENDIFVSETEFNLNRSLINSSSCETGGREDCALEDRVCINTYLGPLCRECRDGFKEDENGKCRKECKCDNGQCVEDNRKLVCQCPPEYGLLSSTECQECKCGKGINCTFKRHWLDLKPVEYYCFCPNGTLKNEPCKEEFNTSTTWYMTTTNKSSLRPGSTKYIFDGTTDASNFSLDFNWTSYEPSNFTYDFNETTILPWNSTTEFNITSFDRVNFTRDINSTTEESPLDIYNRTTYKPLETTITDINNTILTRITRSTESYLSTLPFNVTSSVSDCDCGGKSTGCQYNREGTKICTCLSGYSQIGGVCSDCYCGEKSSSCRFDFKGNKICSCFEGYSQRNRSCSKTCLKDSDCLNAGHCRRGEEGAYFCECKSRFSGDLCDVNDMCENLKPVCSSMGAVCRLVGMRAVCECPADKAYVSNSGLCEDICDTRRCIHGKCEIVGKSYKCRCDEGFTGKHCEERTSPARDTCDTRNCFHGKCEKIDNVYICRCDKGFSGIHCDEVIKNPLGFHVLWITLIVFIAIATLLFIGICCLLVRLGKHEEKMFENITAFKKSSIISP